MERLELLKKSLDAVGQYGEGSEQHRAASAAFRTGVETYIGELYERCEDSLRGGEWKQDNWQPTKEYEEFFSRAPRLMQVIGLNEMHFVNAGSGSFTMSSTGEVRKLEVGSA